MITRESAVETIVRYVRENFMIDKQASLPLDRSLMEAGIIDSYGAIDLVAFLETEFGITIADDEITTENLGSIYKMADFALNRKAESGGVH